MGTLTGPASATWSDNNCNGGSSDIATWKRSQAKDYAQRDSNEGYEWGGGCFKLNDQDDTPNQPDSGGEGTDCSGLVFKSWALRADGRNDSGSGITRRRSTAVQHRQLLLAGGVQPVQDDREGLCLDQLDGRVRVPHE